MVTRSAPTPKTVTITFSLTNPYTNSVFICFLQILTLTLDLCVPVFNGTQLATLKMC